MIEIRPEVAADHARVFEIEAAAFERRNEAELVDRLREVATPQLSLVAHDGDRLLGHIFFSPVAVGESPASPAASGLAPVAVDPALQRSGVGVALIQAGLAACPALGWQAVFLVGSPVYYARFGFTLAAPMGFTYGDPLFDAVLQVNELAAGALEGMRGCVHFHPAFVETGCG
jgi:putative acetyltransferase